MNKMLGVPLALSWSLLSACLPNPSGLKTFSDIQDTTVINHLDIPTSLRFTSKGGVFVTEKSGILRYFKSVGNNQSTVVADLSKDVYNIWDRGLLSVEVHPRFPEVPYVYVFYTYDAKIGGTAPAYDDFDNRISSTPGGASGRLSRLKLAPQGASYKMIEEKVLIHDWCQVFPSHTVGTVRFGKDGALYASAGDAAAFDTADWGQFENFCNDPLHQGGSLRAQRHAHQSSSVSTLDGSIIRIDSETGNAMPDNPLVMKEGTLPVGESRVVAYGLRNPYRFNFRPGTNEVWIADVSWNSWEEINRIEDPTKLSNFGWPCMEGPNISASWEMMSTPVCQALYTESEKDSNAIKAPYYTYVHSTVGKQQLEICPGASGAITGVTFYEKGNFPERFQGALMMADYVRGCIWAHLPGQNGLPDNSKQELLVKGADSIADLETGPDGNLYYISVVKGEIHQLSYSPLYDDVTLAEADDAPIPTITLPAADVYAHAREMITFEGTANTFEGKPVEEASLSWRILINHCADASEWNCHQHIYQEVTGKNKVTFTMPTDHSYPSYITATLKSSFFVNGVQHTSETSRKVSYALTP